MGIEILKLVLELGDNAGSAAYWLIGVYFIDIIVSTIMALSILYVIFKLIKNGMDNQAKKEQFTKFFLDIC